jgi:hypothetical protein
MGPGSGMLRVTTHPGNYWPLFLFEITLGLIFAHTLYSGWRELSLFFRAIIVWAIAGEVAALIYQFSGKEIVEFDQQRLSICQEVHGWERKNEYPLDQCSELAWVAHGKSRPAGFRCKVGWRIIQLGKDLSEAQASEILVALPKDLPDVAQKICAFAGGKEHFLTLGLSGRK